MMSEGMAFFEKHSPQLKDTTAYVTNGLFPIVVVVIVIVIVTGLKIMAGHRTMSGQDDYLSGQNLGLVVILAGHILRGFQVIN